MFTGLIEEVGRIHSVVATAAGRRLWFEAEQVLTDARMGDSIACDGCCLTVVESRAGRFAAEAVPETLRVTTLGTWEPGQRVNLERSLRFDQRLGGHLVQGHVDGVGEVADVRAEGDGKRITIALPAELQRFVAHKGSLAVDGVSLTVAAVRDGHCEIALIPHTLKATTAGEYATGRRVNLEVDLMARYLARMLEMDRAGSGGR